VAKKLGRFSGIIGGLQAEKDKVSATDKIATPSRRVPRLPVRATSIGMNHYRARPKKPNQPDDSKEDCDDEPSGYVEFLEQEVDRLTDYAKKAEETKESLRGLENLRKHLAYSIFAIIGVWLIAVFGLVFLGSMDVYYFKGACNLSEHNLFFRSTQVMPETCTLIAKGSVLSLSENIVIALITTTTFNILGLAYIVARWLYPDSAGKKKSKDKKTESGKKKNNDVDADQA
jgi:hypothetical protein